MDPASPKHSSNGPTNHLPLKLLVALSVLASLLLGFFADRSGAPLMRDQHVTAAQRYAEKGIDLLHPVVLGFNTGDTPTILEFPLWQAFASVALKLSGGWIFATNLVSLLCFTSCFWPLYQMVSRHADERRAWWTLAFFSAQPLSIVLGVQAGTDGISIAGSLWFFYAADRALASGSWPWWLATAALGALAALLKAPFFFAYGLAAALLLALGPQARSVRTWLALAGAGGLATVVLLIWTRYTEAQYALAEYPLVDLRLSHNPDQIYWWFGDLAYRLNPIVWIKAGWHLLSGLYGSAGLVVLSLAGLVISRSRLSVAWLLGGFAATLVFTHVILHHRHYFLIFSAPCALLAAESLVWLERNAWSRSARMNWGVAAIAAIGFIVSLGQGISGMELTFDSYARRMGRQIAEKTQPGDRLIIQGGGWGGEVLMWAGRRGLSVWGTDFASDPQRLARLRQLGYNRLVVISESPALYGVQVTNPGNSTLQRSMWWDQLDPGVHGWPTVLSTPDLWIAEIPPASMATGER